MLRHIRKIATGLLAVVLALSPTLSEAAQYQYFRMYGHGGLIAAPPGGQPQGDISYQISGALAAIVGQPYAATSSVAGAVGKTVFFIQSGSLAPGLSLDVSTGTVSGIPTTAGSYPVVLGVRDSLNSQGFAALNLTTNAAVAVNRAPSSIGTEGTAYAAQFVASGGSAPYVFSTTSELPPGLSLSQNGLLAGVPSHAGNYQNIIVHVADAAAGSADTIAFAIKIAKPLAVAWSPASGQVGIAYVASLPQANGGSTPYVYSLNGQAPNGLTFNNATGAFAGTPAIAGSYSVGVTVVDADGRLAQSGASSLVIAPGQVVDPAGPLALAGSPPATAQIGIGYIASFTASGGSQTGYVFELAAGVLPPGLSLDSNSGAISGTPSALGTYSGIQVRVTDSTAETALSGLFAITVAPQPALIISGNPSSSAQVGKPYQADFAAFDGTGAGYTFTSIGSALPPGLALSNVGGASGSLIGTPTFVGTYSGLQVRVTDSGGHTADSQAFSITVAPRAGTTNVAIAGSPQRWADIGVPYSAGFSASGGTGSYTFTASGNVPLGLSMSPDGILSGTPTAAGAGLFTVQVVDSEGDAASASFTITVAQPLDLTVGSLPYGFKNAGYSYQLTAFGGTQPYSYVQSGLLPPGVALNAATGLISGAPSTGGGLTYNGIISVVDALGRTIARNATMTVYDPLSVSFQPPAGAVGEPYSAMPTAAGGAGGYVFSVKAFPSGGPVNLGAFGLTLDPSTGVISGVPTTAGVTPEFNYMVTDKAGLVAAAPSSDGGFHTSIFIAGALSVTGSPSQVATVGQPYTATFSAVGGTGSPTFAIASGVLPAWLSLNPTTGVLAGTPQAADVGAVGPLTVSVADQGQGTAASSPFTISVAMPPVLSGEPATATLGSGYSFDLTTLTTGGRAPYSYAVTSGALPAGMSIASTAVTASQVTGQTASAGITVTDVDGRSAFGSLTFAVASATATASLSSPAAVRSGAAVAGTLATNLSGATWSFSQTPSSPSLGLSASEAGFSGMAPSVASVTSYSFTATATAGSNFAASAPVALTVAPVLAISDGPASDVAGDVGLAIAATPAASVGSTGIGTISYALLQGGSPVTLSSSCPGLSFSSSTAVISGTPSTTCSLAGLSIRATDAGDGAAATTSSTFAIAVSSTVSTPTGSFTASATAGANYSSGPLTSTGGSAPLAWSVATGTLPGGLALDANSGVLSGVPNATGTYNFTIKRTDALGQSSAASATETIVVAAATLTVSPSAQTVHVGQPISGNFATSFSAPVYSVVQTPATQSLSLSGSGTSWSGTAPSVGSQSTFGVTWTGATSDGVYSKVGNTVQVTVYPALSMAAPTNFTGDANASLSFSAPAVSNKIGSATWALKQNGSTVTGVCGLVFDTSTGRLSGTTSACSASNLTYVVTDSADGTTVTSTAFSVTIGPAQTAPTGTLAGSGIAGVAYSSGPLATNGGTGPFTWSLATGSLPSGLALSASTGVVSGTPNAQGTYNFTLKVTDAYSVASPASATQTVTITQTPTNNGAYTTAAQVGTSYTKAAPATSGGPGTPPYAYHLFTGTIPPGLTLNSDGSLTGTPTTAGSYTFQVYLTDANNVSSGSAGTTTTITVSGATASGTLSAPTAVRSGAAIAGTLTTSRTSPVWTLSQAPSSPSLSLAASGNTSSATFSGTAPSVASQTAFQISAAATSGGSSSNTGTIGAVTVNPTLTISGGPIGTVSGVVGNAITTTSATSASGVVGTASYALLQNGAAYSGLNAACGLSFSAASGQISGVPSQACSVSSLSIQVADSWDSATVATSSTFALSISADTASATLTTASKVRSGAAITGTLSTDLTGATWSFVQSPTSPSLGISVSGASFSGTAPSVASETTFSATATASAGSYSVQASPFSVTVEPALAISGGPSGTLSGSVGNAIATTAAPVVSGVAGVATLSLVKNGSPYAGLSTDCSGLSFSASTGQISGAPTASCSVSGLALSVTDSFDGATATTAVFSIAISNTSASAVPATASTVRSGAAISGTLASSFNSATWSFSQTPASPSLGLTGTGSAFAGSAPTVSSQTAYSVTATATSGSFLADAAPFAVTVAPVLTASGGPTGTVTGDLGVAIAPTSAASVGSTGVGGISYALTQNGSSVTLSNLCAGLSFSASSAVISGTPTAICSVSGLAIKATDSFDGAAATTSPTFAIAMVNSQTAPTGTLTSSGIAGVAYSSGPLATNGGTGPFTWSLATGLLPSGLTLSASTGVVSGIPSAQGTFNFTLQVTDAVGAVSPASATKTVAITQTPSNNGTYIATAQVGTPYSATAPATSGGPGTPPYVYHLFNSTLPPGLTLNSDGSLTGTPTTAGSYTFQVNLTDANNVSSASGGASTTITVSAATVSGTLNAPTTVRSGASFSGTLTTSRTSPSWTMASTPTSPSLGLTVSGNTSSATFIGTAPTVAAQQPFSLQATATSGGTSSNTATFANLTVNPPLSISGGPSGTVTAEVGSALTATSAPSVSGLVGTGAYALLQSGTPITLSSSCAGLSFSSATGVISGTPTASCGIANLTIQVTDSNDSVVAATSASFGITISAALGAPTGSFAAAGTVGSGYSSGPVSVSGGVSPYTWSVASGAIPTGLTLDPSSGSLSGTPTTASAYTFTVKATDSLGHASAASASQTVTISAATGSIALTTPANGGGVHGGKTVSGTLTTSLPNPTWTFSISPATSPPLVLTPSGNTSSATFSGTAPVTPNGTLQYHYVITATASSGSFSTTTSSVNFYDVEPLVLTGGPSGTVGGDVGAAITSTAAIGYKDSANISQPTLALMQGGSAVSLGTLCPGLAFSATNGVISGTPTTTCSQSGLTIMATDSDGSTASTAAFAISIGTAQTAPTGTLTSSGIAGVAYSSGPLTTHGGTSPLTWSVASGSLPSGLTLSASSGVVSGTPSAQGTYNFTLKVTDAVGVASPASATQTVAITQTPSNSGTYTTTAQVGSAYSKTAPATSGGPGTPPYAYHLFTGTIPPGLTLNSDGSLTGTPTTAGSYSFQVYLSDANNVSSASAGTSTTITVSSATASITAGSTYRAGDAISGTVSSSLTSPTWTFSQTPTTPSLSLSGSGSTLSGAAPTVASQTTYSVTATATSGSYTVNASTITIKVNPTLSLTGGPSGTIVSAVNAAMTTTAAPTPSGVVGTASYSLLKSSVAYSTLSTDCPGLSLSASTGQISGTPTASCAVSGLQIQLTDSSDSRTAKGANTFALSISGTPVVIDPTNTPKVEAVGETNYPWSASVSGGTGPYTISFTGGTGSGTTGSISGNAWNGITFSTSGINNTGQPTQAGTLTNFTAVATDSRGVTSAPVQFTLTVNAALQWTGSWPASCIVGQTCSASFTATGGQADYNYSGGRGYFFSSTGTAISGLQIVSGGDGTPVAATTGAVGAGPAVFAFVPSTPGTLSGTYAQVNTYGTAKGTVSNISVVAATASASLTASNVRQGGAISGTLTSNYTSPTWSFTYSPTTPAFTLTPSGSAFSGTAPSVASQTTFSITAKATAATGGGSVSASAMSLKVYPAVAISGGPSGTLSGTSGTAITATAAPTVSNLMGSATYSLLQSGSPITLSSVCSGLAFSTSTGVISGTPTAACSTGSTLTIRVTDGFDSTTAATSAAFAVTVTAGASAPSEALISSVTSGGGIVSSGTIQSATQSPDGAWMKVNPAYPLVIQYSQPVAATGLNLTFYCPSGFDGVTGESYTIDSSNDGVTWTTRATGSYDYPSSGCPQAVPGNGLGAFTSATATYWRFNNTSGTYSTVDQFRPK